MAESRYPEVFSSKAVSCDRERMDSASSDLPHQAAQMAVSRLEQISLLDTFTTPHLVRNTGIICTIGEWPCI